LCIHTICGEVLANATDFLQSATKFLATSTDFLQSAAKFGQTRPISYNQQRSFGKRDRFITICNDVWATSTDFIQSATMFGQTRQRSTVNAPFTVYRLPFTGHRLPFTLHRLPFKKINKSLNNNKDEESN